MQKTPEYIAQVEEDKRLAAAQILIEKEQERNNKTIRDAITKANAKAAADEEEAEEKRILANMTKKEKDQYMVQKKANKMLWLKKKLKKQKNNIEN